MERGGADSHLRILQDAEGLLCSIPQSLYVCMHEIMMVVIIR